jgi:hypothetical protein
MADSMQSLLNKHVEKIILAAAVGIFAIALTVFVMMRGSIFGDQETVRTNVESLVKSLSDARKAPGLDKALTAEERIALGIEQAPLTGDEFIKDRDALASAAWDAKTDKWAEPKVVGPPPKVVDVVAPEIVGVADLQVFQGRGTTAETVPTAVFKIDKPVPLSDIVWAGVVGHIDLTAQLAAYNKAHVPLDPSGILISKVELQRREQKPDGTWSEWKPVMPALAAAAAVKWPKAPANPRDKAAANAWYVASKALQADIRRMPLYTLVPKDKHEGQTADVVAGAIKGVEQPDMKRPPAEPAPVAPAAPGAAAPAAPAPDEMPAPAPETAPAGAASPWATAVAHTPAQPTPGAQTVDAAAPKHVVATLWAYDTSVEPGKSYQYQMRASVVSPIYSVMEVRDDKVRWTLEFPGPWSAASREVAIPNLAEFFFIGTASGDKVNLELHRWILGQWVIQPSVQCSLGAPIVYVKRQKLMIPGAKAGSKESASAEAINVDLNPQVFLVDVMRRFPYVPEGNVKPTLTNILIYADVRGQLERRTEWDDKNAARAAKAEREGGVVGPGPGPKGPPPPSKPKTERPTPKAPTPRSTK